LEIINKTPFKKTELARAGSVFFYDIQAVDPKIQTCLYGFDPPPSATFVSPKRDKQLFLTKPALRHKQTQS
jgi:hypothetical protein